MRIVVAVMVTLAVVVAVGLLAGCGPKESTEPGTVAAYETPDKVPAPGAPIPSQPPTNDANVVLTRMVSVYKKLDSLFVISEADMTQPGVAFPIHQVATLKYSRDPASMLVVVEDPVAGTHGYFGDGSSVVFHDALRNTFMRRDFHGDLKGIATIIDHYAPQLVSPLVFLQSKSVPTGTGPARIIKTENIDGKPAYVIAGRFADAYLQAFVIRLGFPDSVKPVKGDFTLWIDKETCTLRRTKVSLAWRGTMLNPERKVVRVSPSVEVSEKVTTLVPNPKFSKEEFRFLAPKGAVQTFREGRD